MKKRGKQYKRIAVLPNGVRRDTAWELPIRAALLSAEHGSMNNDHLHDIWVLAEIAKRTGAKAHVLTHAEALQRLAELVYNHHGQVDSLTFGSIDASASILLEYVKGVSNYDIAKASTLK